MEIDLVLHHLEAWGMDGSLCRDLLKLHRDIWNAEDRCRSRILPAPELASLKHHIDRSNGARHQRVDALDGLLRLMLPEGDPPRALSLYSETPGELTDRILIVSMKLEHTSTLAVDLHIPPDAADRARRSVVALGKWLHHLLECLRIEVQDLQEGRARMPPRAEIKLYNDPWLNPVMRMEQGCGISGAPSQGREFVPERRLTDDPAFIIEEISPATQTLSGKDAYIPSIRRDP